MVLGTVVNAQDLSPRANKPMENPESTETQRWAKTPHVSLTFWLQWVLATTVGISLGGIVFIIFAMLFPNVIVALAFFAWIGLLQWIVLRRRLPNAKWWIPTTIAGWLVGGYIGLYTIGDHVGTDLLNTVVKYLHDPSCFSLRPRLVSWDMAWGLGEAARLVVKGSLFGFSIGFLQWFVLRRYVRRAGWWILVTAVSMVISWTAWEIVGDTEGPRLLYGIILTGVLFGATTGIPLVWLLRHPKLIDSNPR